MRCSKKSERGFTLLEALVSMAIMVIGVLGVLNMMIYTAQSTGYSQKKTEATALARDLIDQMSAWEVTDARLAPVLASGSRTLTCANTTKTAGMTSCAGSSDLLKLGTARPLVAGTDVDHVDADLGTNYAGLPLPAGFERVWNVYPVEFSHANHVAGTTDVLFIVVVVRFWHGGSPRDVVLTASKVNFGEVAKGGML